jgi:hypothetical protein
MNDLVRKIAEALAEKYTPEWGGRNPYWNIDLDDGPDNEYHLRVPMSDRIQQGPFIKNISGDGAWSYSVPSCQEIAEAIAPVIEEIVQAKSPGVSDE